MHSPSFRETSISRRKNKMTFFASYKDLLSADMPRMKRAAAIIMICLSVGTGVLSGNVFPNPFAILFASFSTATLSATLFMYRSPAVFITPALVFPITAFMTRSVPASLFSIAFVIPAVVIAVSLYRKQSKSAAVFFSSLSSFLPYFFLSSTLLTSSLFLILPRWNLQLRQYCDILSFLNLIQNFC